MYYFFTPPVDKTKQTHLKIISRPKPKITEINESNINPYRSFRFPERKFRLSGILFTVYLQRLHFYLQSKSLKPKNIKVDLLHQ